MRFVDGEPADSSRTVYLMTRDNIMEGDTGASAVARGFGPPETTLEFASRLVRAGGRIVISEPPTGDRWDGELVAELGLRRRRQADGRVAVFDRDGFT